MNCIAGTIYHILVQELRLTGDQIENDCQAWWGRHLVWVRQRDLAEALGPSWPFGGDDDPSTPVA